MKTKFLTLSIIFSTIYVILGFMFQNIAFGNIQIRIADALYPLIAILGLPCLIGTFFGHLIFNLYGFGIGIALGIGDLASPFIFLIPKWLIYKFGKIDTPSLIITTWFHVLFVMFWIAWLLYTLFNIPFWLSVLTVGIGEFITEFIIGIPLALSIKRKLLGNKK